MSKTKFQSTVDINDGFCTRRYVWDVPHGDYCIDDVRKAIEAGMPYLRLASNEVIPASNPKALEVLS